VRNIGTLACAARAELADDPVPRNLLEFHAYRQLRKPLK